MPATEKYYVGPKLLGEIRDTITRVAGMPNATRRVEQPVRLQDMPRPGEGGGGLRAATFTGSWSINTTKTVTFQGVTTTPNTVVVTNQLFTIGDACEEQVAYIGRVSSIEPAAATAAWHLLNVQHHETSVIVSVTLTTAALEFTRRLVWVPYPGETATLSIPISEDTSCSS